MHSPQKYRHEMPTKNLQVEIRRDVCRISAEPLIHVLMEALRLQHQALDEVYGELEAERSASATTIDDALLMISRLQEEKARLAMEAAQFKRVAEEQLSHAEEKLRFCEDVLVRKDEEIRALRVEIGSLRDCNVGSPSVCYGDNGVNSSGRLESGETGGATVLRSSFCETKSYGDLGEYGHRHQVNMIERTRYSHEVYYSANSLFLWEQIEGVQKRLHILSQKKTVNNDLNDEWGLILEELKEALASYVISLRQGLKSHSCEWFPEINEASTNRNQNDRPVDVYIDTKQMGDQHQKSDPFSQTYEQGKFALVSTEESNIVDLMESTIKDLSIRVHALEADGKAVKQAIDSVRRQHYCVKHLKHIVQGFQKVDEPHKGQIIVNMQSPQKVSSTASLIKYFLSQLPVGVRCLLSFILFRSYKHMQKRGCMRI